MIEECLIRIMQVREMQESYMTCTNALEKRNLNYNKGDGKVLEDLISWELDEWRGLLLWGLVADQPTQDRIKAAAHERFLSNKRSVRQWLNNDIAPDRYLSATDEEFRDMAKKAFAPNEKSND